MPILQQNKRLTKGNLTMRHISSPAKLLFSLILLAFLSFPSISLGADDMEKQQQVENFVNRLLTAVQKQDWTIIADDMPKASDFDAIAMTLKKNKQEGFEEPEEIKKNLEGLLKDTFTRFYLQRWDDFAHNFKIQSVKYEDTKTNFGTAIYISGETANQAIEITLHSAFWVKGKLVVLLSPAKVMKRYTEAFYQSALTFPKPFTFAGSMNHLEKSLKGVVDINISTKLNPVATETDMAATAQRLNLSFPSDLHRLYTEEGNGTSPVNDDSLTLYPTDKIIGFADFLQKVMNNFSFSDHLNYLMNKEAVDTMRYDIFKEKSNKEPLIEGQKNLVQWVNENYFVFMSQNIEKIEGKPELGVFVFRKHGGLYYMVIEPAPQGVAYKHIEHIRYDAASFDNLESLLQAYAKYSIDKTIRRYPDNPFKE